jgi:hypothetical protein
MITKYIGWVIVEGLTRVCVCTIIYKQILLDRGKGKVIKVANGIFSDTAVKDPKCLTCIASLKRKEVGAFTDIGAS